MGHFGHFMEFIHYKKTSTGSIFLGQILGLSVNVPYGT